MNSKGVKGTSKNPWKDISVELPVLSQFVHCVEGDGRDISFWEDM